MSILWVILLTICNLLFGYFLENYMYSAILAVGEFIGYLITDCNFYIKNNSSQAIKTDVQMSGPLKDGEYRPIIIKIDINERGGYDSIVYNRHGTHLTKENRRHFINILNQMIVGERDIRSHMFQLLTFKKKGD
jgi:hypothetical protein